MNHFKEHRKHFVGLSLLQIHIFLQVNRIGKVDVDISKGGFQVIKTYFSMKDTIQQASSGSSMVQKLKQKSCIHISLNQW